VLRPTRTGEGYQASFTLALDLEINLQNNKQPFLLRPMPDDVDAAIAAALDDIKERLTESLSEVTVLFGKP